MFCDPLRCECLASDVNMCSGLCTCVTVGWFDAEQCKDVCHWLFYESSSLAKLVIVAPGLDVKHVLLSQGKANDGATRTGIGHEMTNKLMALMDP